MLLVPNVFFDLTHRFSELEGADRLIQNPGFERYHIGIAQQGIRFTLDKGGVELASEAKLLVVPMPSHFVFCKPFLIYVKARDTKQPFFAMWVDNAELLCKP